MRCSQCKRYPKTRKSKDFVERFGLCWSCYFGRKTNILGRNHVGNADREQLVEVSR